MIHELCHRLVSGNKIRAKFRNSRNFSLNAHKLINLILYDIWTNLYGKKFANQRVKEEKEIGRTGTYKKAWEWALQFSKEERAKKFKEFVSKSKQE